MSAVKGALERYQMHLLRQLTTFFIILFSAILRLPAASSVTTVYRPLPVKLSLFDYSLAG